MGHYFFHFLTETGRDEDLIGLELPSVEDAYLEAVRAARGMAGELLGEGVDPGRCAFEITDERGEPLLSLDFAELLRRPRSPPSSNEVTARLTTALEDSRRRVSATRQALASTLVQTRATIEDSLGLIARMDGCAAWRLKPVEDRTIRSTRGTR